MLLRFHKWLLLVPTLVCAALARGAVRMPHVFTNDMVLQRDATVPIWGWATPGSRVSIRFAGQHVSAIAGRHGQWMAKLSKLHASARARNMWISDGNHVVIHNVLVGDVWLCAGQSNMQFPVDGWWGHVLRAKLEVAAATHPLIRLLKIPRNNTPKAQKDFKANWMSCSPAHIKAFSAVAYFFGRDLSQDTHVPIGLIDSSYGGTVIQSWTPMSALRHTPALHGDIRWFAIAARRYKQAQKKYNAAMKAWRVSAHSAAAKGRPQPPKPKLPRPQNPFTLSRPSPDMAPASIYHAMIEPLIPFALRGVVWYQGENNAWVNDRLYGVRLKAMINGWRDRWQAPNLPFLIVQIAPYAHYPDPTLGVPIVWQGEQQAVRTLPHTGIVGTMDIGDLHNIHFRDKQDVGKRLAALALQVAYGQGALRSIGPMYQSSNIVGHKIIIHFTGVRGGLRSSNGKPLNWFMIAAASRKFVPAMARIDGSAVVIWAKAIRHPLAVRFAWNSGAQPNLIDGAGMPVLPFRTDSWPLQ